MKKKILLFFFLLSIILDLSAQAPARYIQLTKEAKESFDKKDYKRAVLLYREAFKANFGRAYRDDRYNAACTNAMAGYKDSAFYQLFKVVDLYNYSDYDHISKDSNLVSLKSDKRWNDVLEKVKQNIGKTENSLNKSLVVLLDSVYRQDQSSRLVAVGINSRFSPDSKERKEALKMVNEKDSINLFIVSDIIKKYGWVGKNIVGSIGNSTLCLVIQRADLKTQEKYLPVMREAFKNGNAEASDLAFLEDIVALREGKKQIYGTQIKITEDKRYYILPIEDPENLDNRRIKMGLSTMDEYLVNWKMKWDINNYKKDLLVIEKEKIQY